LYYDVFPREIPLDPWKSTQSSSSLSDVMWRLSLFTNLENVKLNLIFLFLRERTTRFREIPGCSGRIDTHTRGWKTPWKWTGSIKRN